MKRFSKTKQKNQDPMLKKGHPSRVFLICLFLVLMTLANFIISYTSFPGWAKLILFVTLVCGPAWYLTRPRGGGTNDTLPFYLQESLPPIPLWVWALLWASAFSIRFWKFDSLFLWPFGDEALCGLAGIDLSQKFNFHYFYTAGQDPPTLFWINGLFTSLSRSSFFTLWFPPALISCLSVLAGYFAARQFFSKSFSFLCTGLLAFSFWPLYLGRVAFPGILVLFWWPITLYCLGKYLKAKPSQKEWMGLILGFVNGFNSFTFTSWPVFTLAVCAAVLGEGWAHGKKAFPRYITFSLGFFFGLVPFLAAILQTDFNRHISDVAMWSRPIEWRHQVEVVWNYLYVLGWGTNSNDNFNAPLQGGFLNPVWATFLVLGLAGFTRIPSRNLARWVIGFGIFFLLPGFLTVNMDGFRIIQILPLLLVLTAFGCRVLLEWIPSGTRLLILSLMFVFSAGFDMDRLTLPYRGVDQHPQLFQATGKSLARYRAYQILKEQADKKGPGWILGEWDIPADRTLEVMTYYFNAGNNTALSTSPTWLAVMTDAHYLPFLKERFPDGDWRVLDADLDPESPRLLGVLTLTDANRDQLMHWTKAEPGFTLLNYDLDHLHDRGLQQRFDQDVQRCGDWVKDDPFLASMFWEKVASIYYYFGNHYPEHLGALVNAVQYGYPASHLYGQLASLYMIGGDKKGAEEAALKAKKSETNYPWH